MPAVQKGNYASVVTTMMSTPNINYISSTCSNVYVWKVAKHLLFSSTVVCGSEHCLNTYTFVTIKFTLYTFTTCNHFTFMQER